LTDEQRDRRGRLARGSVEDTTAKREGTPPACFRPEGNAYREGYHNGLRDLRSDRSADSRICKSQHTEEGRRERERKTGDGGSTLRVGAEVGNHEKTQTALPGDPTTGAEDVRAKSKTAGDGKTDENLPAERGRGRE